LKRVKGAIRNLEPLIDEVTNMKFIEVLEDPPELDLKTEALTILFNQGIDWKKQ